MLSQPFAGEPIPRVLYKYLPASRHAFSVLGDMRVRFTQPSALNDPYEGTVAVQPFTDPRFPGTAKEAAAILAAELNLPEFRAQVDADIGVLSLSEDGLSPRLWAHYAADARGFCIGFRTDAAMFAEQEDPNFQTTLRVVYCDGPLPMPVRPGGRLSRSEAIPYMFGRKFVQWSDEREVRVVRALTWGDLDDEHKDANGMAVRRLRFHPDDVVEIVFGARATTWTCQKVAAHCQANGIRPTYRRARILQGQFRVILEPIDPSTPF